MSSQRDRRIAMGIVLATLALCALFLAQGTTRMLAAHLFVGDATEPVIGGAAGSRLATTGATVHGHKNPDPILDKNIFDSQTGSLLRSAVADDTEGDGQASETGVVIPADEESVQACSGNTRLVGTIVAPSFPDWSFAAVNATGTAMLYRTGMDIGGMTLVGIRPDRVYLAPKSGALCKIQMFMPSSQAGPPKPQLAANRTANAAGRALRAADQGGISDAELQQGIQKVSDTEYNVQQSLVSKILENQAALMRSARVIPHEEGGRVVGVKLYGIRRNSILGQLGIQNGDMLRSINGFDMSSPDSALKAYTKLRNADHLTVAVERRGNPVTIDYNIQ